MMRQAVVRAVVVAIVVATAGVLSSAQGRRFFDDDPIQREPDSQDASQAQAFEIDLLVDFATNLFGKLGDQRDVRAQNVNTVDEVPDSSWFTNRVGTRPITAAELARGPLTGDGPAPGRWSIIAPKLAGFAPGFTMRDAQGVIWFVSFDAEGFPEAATGAILVANKLFWGLGYWQVENYFVEIPPDRLDIDETARFTPLSGKRRTMRQGDLDAVLRRAHRSENGTYRAVAARIIPGRVIGGFRYYGTRPDDPNDIVPHEHRRELRALKVFGAWTNLVDMKAGNTLDSVVEENGRRIVRHYLQDVGSTFGTGANGPREWEEGYEYLYEGSPLWKRLVSMGFYLRPWQTVDYDDVPGIGRFEGEQFDPTAWRPRVPTAAFLRARADDTFWAARRVVAFSDELIRAAVKEGRYSDPVAEAHLADVLIARRNKIAAAYLPAVNPVVDLTLSADGTLRFRNAAVDAGVAPAPPGGYRVAWARFDNATGASTALGADTTAAGPEVGAPAALPTAPGAFLHVQIASATGAPEPWTRPVHAYFKRTATGWTLVGFERLP